MSIGIYCIENMVNNKKYIGKSKTIEIRWDDHKRRLKNKIHDNKHIQRAWYKYGEENFKFWIIEECKEDELDKKEMFYISLYNTKNIGYNMTDGGEGKLNCFCSEETRKRISEMTKGKNKGKKAWNKGIHLSDEHKKRISKSKKGIPVSEKTKEKISLNLIHSSEENNANSKLNKQDILKILDLHYNYNLTGKEISNIFLNCSENHIYRILRGDMWKNTYQSWRSINDR